MVKQLIYIGIVLIVLVIVYFRSREPLKAILTASIIITPWQGGLWMASIAQDLYLSTIIFFILFVLSFFEKNQRRPLQRFYIPVLITALFMLIGCIFSASNAVNQIQANRGIYSFVERYLMFYCIYNGVRKPSDIKYVLAGFFISIGFQGALAMIQFKFWSFTIGVIDERDAGDFWRANGTFFHANAFGMFLAIIIPLAYRMIMVAYREGKKRARNIYILVFVLGVGGLVTCQNRGSWIGFSIAMVALFIVDMVLDRGKIRRYLTRMLIPLGVLAFIGLLFLGDLLQKRMFESDADIQIENRTRQMEESKALIAEHPWFGVGYQNYREHIGWEFVHNVYLLIASELGYWGLTCFIIFMAIWLYNIIRGSLSNNYLIRNLSLGLGASLIVFLIASIPGPGYHLLGSKLGNHIWMIIGFTAALNDVGRRYDPKKVQAFYRRKGVSDQNLQQHMNQLRQQWKSVVISGGLKKQNRRIQ
ncbi:O-antigen ligase family protein [bacterium]|nr:O-antigen ligase family protein [bacterium]